MGDLWRLGGAYPLPYWEKSVARLFCLFYVSCVLDTDLSMWHCKVCMRLSNTFLRNAYPKLGRPHLPAVPMKASDCLLILPPPLSQIGLIFRLYTSRILSHHHLLLLLCLSTPTGAQAADDTPPLRPILCLALCFAPAQFHVSQLLLNCPLPCVDFPP